jgi:hypothetical protein
LLFKELFLLALTINIVTTVWVSKLAPDFAFTKPSGDAVGLLHHGSPLENLDAKLLLDNFGLYHKPGLQ